MVLPKDSGRDLERFGQVSLPDLTRLDDDDVLFRFLFLLMISNLTSISSNLSKSGELWMKIDRVIQL